KTDVFSEAKAAPTGSVEKRAMDPDRLCPLHNKPHALRKCRTFRSKPIEERKTYLREKNICFRAKDCDKEIVCRECGSKTHTSALHPGPAPWFSEVSADQGEEEETHETPPGTLPAVTSKCTEFFDHFSLYEKASPYTLKTCAGVMETSGRRATNFVVESFDGKIKIKLPTLIECEMIPDDRAEIPTPEIARYFPHLRHVADKIPPLNENAQILILLGRDILRVHKVRQQYNGDHEDPYAQRLDLGPGSQTTHHPDDEKVALSVDDQTFLDIMDKEVYVDQANSWVAPLPFCKHRRRLPNNREMALRTLDRCTDMREHFLEFMGKKQHPNSRNIKKGGTYLCSGSIILKNQIILIRFRKENITVTADIQQMFYAFVVREDHRDYLQFLWYKDNNLNNNITEYRMKVHIFGNSPSPSVAIYGLKRAAQEYQDEYGTDSKEFVMRNFYVDDGLTSVPDRRGSY
ncbi:hypothetical protein M9458_039191, partial [Cirrhinus mrigala]